MPANILPLIAASFGGKATQILAAQGTSLVTLTDINNNYMTRIENLAITFYNDAANSILLYLNDGTSDYLLTTIAVTANIGTTSALTPMNLGLQGPLTSFFQSDELSNKYFDIPAGCVLKARLANAVTSTNYMEIYVKTAILIPGQMPMAPLGIDAKWCDFGPANGTVAQDLTTSSTTPTRIDQILVHSTDTALRTVQVLMYTPSYTCSLFFADIAALSGAAASSGGAAPINLMTHGGMAPYIQVDGVGNKFIDLPAGWKLQVKLTANTTAATQVSVYCKWAKYGSGGILNYDSNIPYSEGVKCQSFITADGTSAKDLTTVNVSAAEKINGISLTTTEPSTTKDFFIGIHDGSTMRKIAAISLPATAGTVSTVVPIQVLLQSLMYNWITTDAGGNKYIELAPGWKLQAWPASAVTTTYNIAITTRWTNFG